LNIAEITTDLDQVPDFELQQNRFALIDILKEATIKMKSIIPSEKRSYEKRIQEFAKRMESAKDPRVKALLADVQGQVSEAISSDEWWTRWGRHFLPSLAGAHLLQQCNNFKDPGIQEYGGPLFNKIRDEVETLFSSIPPPEPTLPIHAGGGNAAPLANMNVYYNYSGGCFDSNGKVTMKDMNEKLVKDLVKGDKVRTSNGNSAEIVAVVKMNCPEGQASLVELEGGLRITAYHPVRISQQWQFPCNISSAKTVPCEAVYAFVLNKESEHCMIINGVECVTLGHNYQEDIVRHAFFGSDLVLNELKKINGWENGLIEFANMATCFVRDTKTNVVCGFNQGKSVMCPGA